MGLRKQREGFTLPNVAVVRSFTSTAAIIKNRVVKLAATGNIKHTTGTSGRAVLGVALAAATGAGIKVPVQLFGVVAIHASTRALATGVYVRATSGAASTASGLGGTVRASTVAMTTALPIRANIVGYSLSSAAAAAAGTNRTVDVMLYPMANNPALL